MTDDARRDELAPLATGVSDAGYEPPQLTTLGTLEQLTQGIVPTSVDTVLPGSMN